MSKSFWSLWHATMFPWIKSFFGEALDGKTTARRQLDALADDLNDTEIGIIIATARALLDAREKGE